MAETNERQPPEAPVLEVREVTKRFPGVIALRNVSLTLRHGESVAVIGENGAGKSTLMKILAGVQSLDSGSILIDGTPRSIGSVKVAVQLGISLIHQELNLSSNLDVASNIFLGHEPQRFGMIGSKQLYRYARRYMDRVGIEAAPKTLLKSMSVGHQQLVEIAKALSVDARILIMDEPTSSLSKAETERLFEVIRDLKNRGVTIVYISHRLGEVEEIADRVVVLRDGENAGELDRDEIDHDSMVRLMVGREISQFYQHQAHSPAGPALEVDKLRTSFSNHPISFSVRGGEIVGMFGLVGAGRTELLQTLFGVDRGGAGQIRVHGKPVGFRSPKDAIAAGVVLVPEDRKLHGLVVEMGVQENLTLASLDAHCGRGGLIYRGKERAVSERLVAKLRIRTPSISQIVQYLSGGNQQKVVLGKWLETRPRVLLLDEPTRGIDIGAKEEIYQMMEQLAGDGVAILFVSSEMEEVLGMSDRTLVMHEGRISGELPRDELSEEAVMQLATGQQRGGQ